MKTGKTPFWGFLLVKKKYPGDPEPLAMVLMVLNFDDLSNI